MKRATWSGNFRIGSLTIPVKLYSALSPSALKFVQVHKDDLAPVQRLSVCTKDGETLSADDITRVVEHDGKPVQLTDHDLELAGEYGKDIVVRQFTNSDNVHTLYYDKPYYLVADTGGELAYVVFRNALKKANKLTVVTYGMYGKQHVGVICPTDGILVLQQLKYATDLLNVTDIQTPSLPQPAPDQVALTVDLIEKYSTDFYIEDYRNEQQDALMGIVERKAKGLKPPKRKALSQQATPAQSLTTELKNLVNERGSTLTAAVK